MSNRINISQTERKTGQSRQTIWRKCREGSFPAPHYIGNRRFWYEREINSWLNKNIQMTPPVNNLSPKKRPLPLDNSGQEK